MSWLTSPSSRWRSPGATGVAARETWRGNGGIEEARGEAELHAAKPYRHGRQRRRRWGSTTSCSSSTESWGAHALTRGQATVQQVRLEAVWCCGHGPAMRGGKRRVVSWSSRTSTVVGLAMNG